MSEAWKICPWYDCLSYNMGMRLLLLIFVLGSIAYFAFRIISSVFHRPAPATPVELQPAKNEVDISITEGPEGMPVITVTSNGATLTVRSPEQASGQYVLSAEKRADNVAVISVAKKT